MPFDETGVFARPFAVLHLVPLAARRGLFDPLWGETNCVASEPMPAFMAAARWSGKWGVRVSDPPKGRRDLFPTVQQSLSGDSPKKALS